MSRKPDQVPYRQDARLHFALAQHLGLREGRIVLVEKVGLALAVLAGRLRASHEGRNAHPLGLEIRWDAPLLLLIPPERLDGEAGPSRMLRQRLHPEGVVVALEEPEGRA